MHIFRHRPVGAGTLRHRFYQVLCPPWPPCLIAYQIVPLVAIICKILYILRMAHVVTERCVDCKHTVCVSVCPVECFHEGENRLWIDPEECIDCGACIPECPEEAIFVDDDIPSEYQQDVILNAEKSQELPLIIEEKTPEQVGGNCKEQLAR